MLSYLIVLVIGVAIGGAVRSGINAIIELRRDEQQPKAFCPGCRQDLVAGGFYVGETDRGLTMFQCRACNKESWWDFDPPVPILIRPSLPLPPPEEK